MSGERQPGLEVLADYFDELLALPEGEDAPLPPAKAPMPVTDARSTPAKAPAPVVAEDPPAAARSPVPGSPAPAPDDVAPPPPDPYALGDVAGAGTLYRAVPVCGFRVLVAEQDVLRVVDCPDGPATAPATATMPGESRPRRVAVMAHILGAAGAEDAAPTHALLARDCDLAILLPAAGTGVRIDPARVTWRGEGGARPWLGGTMREERSVFVDLDGLHDMLG